MAEQNNIISAQDEVLQDLIEGARLQTQLYKTYGEKYPRVGEFWDTLAEETGGHAEALEAVREMLHRGTNLFYLDQYPAERAHLFTIWLQNAVKEARRGRIRLRRALERAMACEKAILDAGFFDTSKADGALFRELSVQRTHDAKDHMKRLEKALELVKVKKRRST